jgi:uncharacterized membrane protein
MELLFNLRTICQRNAKSNANEKRNTISNETERNAHFVVDIEYVTRMIGLTFGGIFKRRWNYGIYFHELYILVNCCYATFVVIAARILLIGSYEIIIIKEN